MEKTTKTKKATNKATETTKTKKETGNKTNTPILSGSDALAYIKGKETTNKATETKKETGNKGKSETPEQIKAKLAAMKETAKKEKKTASKAGVISSIVNILINNGPISRKDVVGKLVKLFPERPEKALAHTVGCQIGKNKGLATRLETESKAFKSCKGKLIIKDNLYSIKGAIKA